MSAQGQGDPGEDLTSRVGAENSCNDMKRAAARKLIECYFYQLTDGCGNRDCGNQYCASSGKLTNLTADEAAAQAINLFSKDARLCDGVHPSKVAKTATEPGPASLTKSLPNKNVNPTCSVEEVMDSILPTEQKNLKSPVDYSSETDDKSIVIDFVKSTDKNLCETNKSKNKRGKGSASAISKKRSQKKSSHLIKFQRNSEFANKQHLLINKLIVLALYLRYVDAKQVINESKTK